MTDVGVQSAQRSAAPPAWGRPLLLTLIVSSLVLWGWLNRYWFMSGDDYLFVADPLSSRGEFSTGYWFDSLRDDWSRRNGRAADGILRLILRPGPWLYPVLAPIMFTGAGLALAKLTARVMGRQTTPPWMWAAGLSAIPVVAWLAPGMTGDVIMWTAAAVNYVLVGGLLAVCLVFLLELLAGRELPWPVVILAAVLAVLTDFLQEVASGALLFAALAAVVVRGPRLGAKAWVLVGASVTAFLVHVTTAQGLWRRSGLIADAKDAGLLEASLRGVAASAPELWWRTWPLWIILSVVLALEGLSHERRATRWSLLVGSGAAVGFSVAGALVRHRSGGVASTVQVVLIAVVLIATMLLIGVALLLGSGKLGVGPLIVWAAFIGSCLFVFGSGATSPRGHFIPALLLLVTALSLSARLLRRFTPLQAVAVVVLTMMVPSAMWFDDARIGAVVNQRFVEARVVPQLEAAGRGEVSVVVLPGTLPRHDAAYARSFYLERYEKALRTYFAIPSTVELKQE